MGAFKASHAMLRGARYLNLLQGEQGESSEEQADRAQFAKQHARADIFGYQSRVVDAQEGGERKDEQGLCG